MRAFLRTLAQRTGWGPCLRPFLFKELPPESGWSAVLGSLCALTFVLMAATGVLLALYYSPSPDKAYPSVSYITNEVPGGALIRGLHHWGAGALVSLVFLHLLTNFLSSAYKAPREATWISGIALLLVTLGLGFTGYLLPWDQKAYWATVVGARLPSDIPVAGGWVTRLILGGPNVSGFTLTRFYAAHTLVLPFAALLLVVFHIYLVRLHGLTELPSPSAKAGRVYRFYPEHLASSSAAFACLLAFLALLCAMAGVPTGPEAGTADKGYAPRPEWYFMWLFQLLTFFPGSTEVIGSLIIPGLLLLLMFALPFLDTRLPPARVSARPMALASGVTAVVGILYLTAMGTASGSAYGERIALPDRPLGPREQAGLEVFLREGCAACHHIAGLGGRRIGPDLANMVAKGRSADYLARYVLKPGDLNRFAHMPAFPLTRQESQDVAYFIRALDFSDHPMKIVRVAPATRERE